MSLETRLAQARAALTDQNLDALLLTDTHNVGYVSGFTGSTGWALVTPTESLFLTDFRYTERAKTECVCFDVIQTSGSGGYSETLKEQIAARPALRRLGFEADTVTVRQLGQFREAVPAPVDWIETSGVIEALRMVKDADEITRIRRAVAAAESAWKTVLPRLMPGISEREFAMELDFAMRRAEAQGVAFETIVASGPQGARPHHTPNDRILQAGEFVTVDWGASVDGYVSDITRTVALGPIRPDQRERYELVLEAQRRAIAAIRPGRNGKEIDSVARDFFGEHGLAEAFGHSLGHSIGRVVHDGPALSQRSESVLLKPGMVVTVEPGLYVEGWGGLRIEEDVLVTEDGCEILTHLPNTLTVIQ